MPLNLAKRKAPPEKWPLEFDLEGVPRDRSVREAKLQQMRETEMSTNRFAVDKAPEVSAALANLSDSQKNALLTLLLQSTPQGREIDLNNPAKAIYQFQEFPKLMYHHDTGHTLKVADAKGQKAAEKRSYSTEPSPNHDYSQLGGNGVAAPKSAAPAKPDVMTDEELAQLEAEDEQNR